MEIIKFKNERDYFDAIDGNTGEFIEYKDEKLSNFDTEKGFVDVEVFLQRKSDGKKFYTYFTRGGQGDTWTDELELWEVKPKVKKPKPFTTQEILDEMDADMENSGMAQGEIENNLNHWKNKYLITRR